MKINFEKNGRKITIEGKDTPSENDYLIIKGKYLDLTPDVSKTDFPNIKFLKNGVNKYLKTKYKMGEMILTIGHTLYETYNYYGYTEKNNSIHFSIGNLQPNNYRISCIYLYDGSPCLVTINEKKDITKLIFYNENLDKIEIKFKLLFEFNGYTYIPENDNDNTYIENLFKKNINRQLGLDIFFAN